MQLHTRAGESRSQRISATYRKSLEQIRHASQVDPVLQKLCETIQRGWPTSRTNVPEPIGPYIDFHDELTVQDTLVFKGPFLLVPAAMRKELMAVIHASHIGVEGCIRRARDCIYWPRMSTALREYILKCDICLPHRTQPCRGPLLQHEVIERPWAILGADLCDMGGSVLLMIVDYYSNYIEVADAFAQSPLAPSSRRRKTYSHDMDLPMCS